MTKGPKMGYSRDDVSPLAGNVNAVKHGGRSKRFGLVHARLGRKFASAYGDLGRLRRVMEELVGLDRDDLPLAKRVKLTAKIQSLIRAEEGARACELMIRKHPGMGPEEIRQQRYAIREFSRERDKLLGEVLGDGQADGTDPWQALDAQRAVPTASSDPPPDHAASSGDAQDARPGDVGGDPC